jgi:hypothetical protein
MVAGGTCCAHQRLLMVRGISCQWCLRYYKSSQHSGIWGIQVSRLLLCRLYFSSSQVSGAALIDHSLATQWSRVIHAAHINGSLRFAAPVVNGVCLILYKEWPTGQYPSIFFHQSLRLRRYWRRSLFFDFYSTLLSSTSPYLSIQISHHACQARPQPSSSYPPRFIPPLFFHNKQCWGPHNSETAQPRSCYVPAAFFIRRTKTTFGYRAINNALALLDQDACDVPATFS